MAEIASDKLETKNEEPKKLIEGMDLVLAEKIVKQCEFYYGDLNLSRDKFLQEQVQLDDGWVPIEVMLRFNRLKSLTNDAAVVAAALSLSSLVEVNADNTKIRRRPSRPLNSLTQENIDEQKFRSIYAKGFPADASLDQLLEFFEKFGATDLIVMRKDKKRAFKGSCFVVFQTKESAKQFINEPDVKYTDSLPMVREFKHDYYSRKANERKTYQECRKREKHELQEKEDREVLSKEIVLGALLLVANMPKTANMDEIRQLFSKYGNVKWIDFEKNCPAPEAIIRFAEENGAKAVLQKVQEEANGKLTFKDTELSLSVVEGEAEQEHWRNVVRMKKDRAGRGRKGFGRKHGGSHGKSTMRKRNREGGDVKSETKKLKQECDNGDSADDGDSSNGIGGDSD